MSWTSSRFACLVPRTSITDGVGARRIIEAAQDLCGHVYAGSRNGALIANLRVLCGDSTRWARLYLLDDEAVVLGDELSRQHDLLDSLLGEIERVPGFVVEATRVPYEPHGHLHVDGFRPQAFERVYPADAVIRDGWVYLHTEAAVRALLASAPCGADPCPPGDDDGESMEYVFGLLKSHRALLRTALDADLAVVYAEMSA